MRILVVDDESIFAEAMRLWMHHCEPEWTIDLCGAGEEATAHALDGGYDVIVLDWNLGHPTITGLTICRDLVERGCTAPIVLLTASDSLASRLESAAAGASDHIGKQLGLEEVHARVKIAAARGPTVRRDFRRGPLRIDVDRQELLLENKPIELSKHQWLLIARLLRRPGVPVCADELCRVAGIEPGEGHKNLRNEVHRLRSRLDKHAPGAGNLLGHIRGIGYLVR